MSLMTRSRIGLTTPLTAELVTDQMHRLGISAHDPRFEVILGNLRSIGIAIDQEQKKWPAARLSTGTRSYDWVSWDRRGRPTTDLGSILTVLGDTKLIAAVRRRRSRALDDQALQVVKDFVNQLTG